MIRELVVTPTQNHKMILLFFAYLDTYYINTCLCWINEYFEDLESKQLTDLSHSNGIEMTATKQKTSLDYKGFILCTSHATLRWY